MLSKLRARFNAWVNVLNLEKLIVLLVAIILAVTVSFSIWSVTTSLEQERLYDPFGNYPIQTVENGQRAPDGTATVSLSRDGGPLIAATKCFNSEVPVTVEGHVSVRIVSPQEEVFPAFSGSRTFLPGCTFFVVGYPENCPTGSRPDPDTQFSRCYAPFRNDFSDYPDLAERLAEYHGQNVNPIAEIIGQETPVQGGVTQTWSSEKFLVTP